MDSLELEAMYVRSKAAHDLLGKVDGYRLLAMILMPSEDVRRASLTQAREQGVRASTIERAKQLTKGPVGRARRARPNPPASKRYGGAACSVTSRRGKGARAVVTLDQALGLA